MPAIDQSKVLAVHYDSRINAYCCTAECTYGRYLELTHGAEENLNIQRGFLSSKSYATLREDLKRGCVLPPLVLAVKAKGPAKTSIASARRSASKALASGVPDDLYIIDGLQRTKALRDAHEALDVAGQKKFLSRMIRLEIWTHIPFGAIAYRMLLLNAGQRPMSIKLQVEILSSQLERDLNRLNGVVILTSTGDVSRRRVAGQFQLAKMRAAFQAWLQGNPHVDIRNAMLEQLLADEAVETLGASVGDSTAHPFHQFVEWVARLDRTIADRDIQFFGNETVLQGVAAAVGYLSRKPETKDRVERCMKLLVDACERDRSADVLGIAHFNEVRKTADTAKQNVGQATRELVFRAFREYFITDGASSMRECWRFSATVVLSSAGE